jgi:hypothetical protein
MLILEYKVAGSKKQYAAIEEAIRIVQFIRRGRVAGILGIQ